MAKQTKAVVPFNILALPAKAAELKIVVEIDGEKLKAEVEQYTKDIASRSLAAKNFRITDDETNQQAADMRANFAKREKALTAIVARVKGPVNNVRAEILDMEHALVDPETAGKDALTQKMNAYLKEKERAAAEVNTAFARVADSQRKGLEAEADELMAMGYVSEADAKRQQAQMTVTATVAVAPDKVEGARIGKKYVGTVTDIIAAMVEIVSGKQPLMHEVRGEMRPLFVVDQTVLNALVNRQQNALNWPGITVQEEFRIASTQL